MTYVHDQQKLTRNPTAMLSPAFGAPTRIPADAAPAQPISQRAQPSPRALVAGQHFTALDVTLAEEDRAFWCFMNPAPRPSFTPELLADLARMQRLIGGLFADAPRDAEPPFDYFVLASRAPGVFNLGGDLKLFVEKIRARERDALRRYAYACVDAGYANYTGYGQGVITIALIQGDALGGGLEAALSCDMLVAERQAKFGLPEIVFNLFPGMGAYTFLSRRVGMLKAEEIIASGRIYTAEEMHALGVVDLLVEPGAGVQAVRTHIAGARGRRLAQSAIYKVRRRVNPVSIEELRDVTDLWVETALRLPEHDLNKMLRIAAAQDRFRARSAGAEAARAA